MIKEVIGGFFYGLFIGFILAIVFGLPASLFSSNYTITNLFSFLSSVSIIICPIWGIVEGIKSGKSVNANKDKVEEDKRMLQRELSKWMDTIRKGYNTNSYESMDNYSKACDNMIFYCAKYFYIPQLSDIVKPYKSECYSSSYSILKYVNGSYVHVSGTDLGEEIHKEIEKIHLENRTGTL